MGDFLQLPPGIFFRILDFAHEGVDILRATCKSLFALVEQYYAKFYEVEGLLLLEGKEFDDLSHEAVNNGHISFILRYLQEYPFWANKVIIHALECHYTNLALYLRRKYEIMLPPSYLVHLSMVAVQTQNVEYLQKYVPEKIYELATRSAASGNLSLVQKYATAENYEEAMTLSKTFAIYKWLYTTFATEKVCFISDDAGQWSVAEIKELLTICELDMSFLFHRALANGNTELCEFLENEHHLLDNVLEYLESIIQGNMEKYFRIILRKVKENPEMTIASVLNSCLTFDRLKLAGICLQEMDTDAERLEALENYISRIPFYNDIKSCDSLHFFWSHYVLPTYQKGHTPSDKAIINIICLIIVYEEEDKLQFLAEKKVDICAKECLNLALERDKLFYLYFLERRGIKIKDVFQASLSHTIAPHALEFLLTRNITFSTEAVCHYIANAKSGDRFATIKLLEDHIRQYMRETSQTTTQDAKDISDLIRVYTQDFHDAWHNLCLKKSPKTLYLVDIFNIQTILVISEFTRDAGAHYFLFLKHLLKDAPEEEQKSAYKMALAIALKTTRPAAVFLLNYVNPTLFKETLTELLKEGEFMVYKDSYLKQVATCCERLPMPI